MVLLAAARALGTYNNPQILNARARPTCNNLVFLSARPAPKSAPSRSESFSVRTFVRMRYVATR